MRNKPLTAVLSILVGFVLALMLPAGAQEPVKQQEAAGMRLVLLDVTVTDQSGNQIVGLTKDDFIVNFDGEAKLVESMKYVSNQPAPAVRKEQDDREIGRADDVRYFVIMFHIYPDPAFRQRFRNDLIAARRASLEFVENSMHPGDKVAIVAYDRRLKIFADFTSDQNALTKAIEEAATFSNGLSTAPASAADDSIFKSLDIEAMINETGRVYDGIELLAEAMKPIPARKALLLFSPGIGEASDFSTQIRENDAAWFDPMLIAIQKANVTVYPLHLMRDTRFHTSE